MAAQNLWGEIPTKGDLRTPIAVLREQAGLLGQATNNVLQGEATIGRDQGFRGVFSGRPHDFVIALFIVAPALDFYRIAILEVLHNVEIYPLTVRNLTNDNELECPDETSFLNAIKDILSSDEIHRIIQALLSQSQAA